MEPSPPNLDDDEDAERYLTLLREGSPTEKVEARDRLGAIFERRGLLDEAAAAYENNIREGVRDPDLYERLAGVYRRQDRTELADEVLQEAHRLSEVALSPEDLEAPTRPMPSAAADVPARSRSVDDQATAPLSRPRGTSRARPSDRVGPARRPWYAATGVVILSLLLCGPLGLILMWAATAWSTGTKLLVTAVSLGAVLLLGSLGVRAGIDSLGIAGGVAPPPAATPFATPIPPIAAPPSGSPSPSPSPASGAAPSPPPVASPPPAAGKPVAAPSPALERVRIANTEGEGANLRERPSGSATRLKNLAEGTILEITGPNQQAEGRTWRPVRDPTGATGWVVADFLGPA